MNEKPLGPLGELETWQDFFNYEAQRIVDLTPEQLADRIRAYDKALIATQAFQHASNIRLKQIAKTEYERKLLEDLKYNPPSKALGETKKSSASSERLSKQEKAIRSMMKHLSMSREEAMEQLNMQTDKNHAKIVAATDLSEAKVCDCGNEKCIACGDCHACCGIESCG